MQKSVEMSISPIRSTNIDGRNVQRIDALEYAYIIMHRKEAEKQEVLMFAL